MAPNFGVGQWWSKQSHKGTSVVVKMENPNYSMLELESPANGFQVDKGGRGKNAKQLTWVLLLKAHKAAGCLAWLANGVWALFASVRRRFTAPSDESGKSSQKSKLYRVIRCFLIASIFLLGFELLAYWKGWHFSRPNLHISPSLSINGLLQSIYSGWLYTRANYLAPPLQYLANVCIILFLIQSADRALLCVGCFWIKLKKIKPVPKCELGDAADLEQGDNAAYPMVLVQMPMCN